MIIKAQPVTAQANTSKVVAMLSTKDAIDQEGVHVDGVMNNYFTRSKIRKSEFIRDAARF